MNTAVSKFTVYIFIPLAFITITAIAGWKIIQMADKNSRDELLEYAQTLAVVADLPHVAGSLPKQAKDINNIAYQGLKRLFYTSGNYGDNIEKIYLIGVRDNHLFYFLESRPSWYSNDPFAEELAQPGQSFLDFGYSPWPAINSHQPWLGNYYNEAAGRRLTAFVPIIDPATSQVIATLGVDRVIKHYYLDNLYRMLPLILTSLAILIIYYLLVRYKKKKPAEIDYIVRYGK